MELIRTNGYPIVDIDVDEANADNGNTIRKGRHQLTYYASIDGVHCLHYELFADNAPDDTLKEAYCFVDDDIVRLVEKAVRVPIAKFESTQSEIESAFDTLKGQAGAYLSEEHRYEWMRYKEKRTEQIQLAYTTAISSVLPKQEVD